MKQYLACLMTTIALLAAGGCRTSGEVAAAESSGPMPLPSNSFARQWTNPLRLSRDAARQLHLSDDALFLYTKGKTVYAIDRSGGNLRFIAEPEVSGGVLHAPLVLGQRVVFPSGSTIDVFSQRGRPVRTIELEKPIRSGAAGLGNMLYIGLDHTAGTGVVAKVDLGQPYRVVEWELMTFGAVTPTPAIFDRFIYAGSEDGRLYAFSEERGSIWTLEDGTNTFNTQGRFVADIKADDYGVYAANTDSKLYCLDRTSGRIRWLYYSGAPLKSSPVVTATMVYQLVPGAGMVAIDKVNGTFNRSPKWTIKNAVQVLSEDDQHVYLRRRDNTLMAVDKASGEIVFTSRGRGLSIFATNTTDATIYGATSDGTIQAIRPILREGEVGEIVGEFRAVPIAAAR